MRQSQRKVKNEDGTTNEVTLPYVMQLSTDATLGGQNETTGYNKIEFTDAQGSHVYIGVNEEGYLVVHYYPVVVASGEVKSTDWVFDQKAVYGVVSIKELKVYISRREIMQTILFI